MIITARQLEELHRASGGDGAVTLPYRARLSPLARDWIRQKKVKIGYADIEPAKTAAALAAGGSAQALEMPMTKSILWWCDGPCGPAKGALASVAREAHLESVEIGVDPRRIAEAIKIIAKSIKDGKSDGAILLVSNGSAAMVYANRCPSLRAILGTCLDSVEQGIGQLAANVLIVEHPYKTLAEVKNLLARFVRDIGKRRPSDEVKKQLQELGTCA